MSIFPIASQYTQAAPPFVPNIQVFPQYSQLVIPACSLVANLAEQAAQMTQVRAWMLQILSSNAWQNQDYATAVKFAIDYHMHRVLSGKSSFGDSLTNDAGIALTLYTSFVVCTTTGLLDSVDPNQRQHLQSNSALYVSLVQEIQGLYQNQNTPIGQQSFQRPGFWQGAVQQRGGAFGQAHVNPSASQTYMGRNTTVPTSVPRQGVVRNVTGEAAVTKATPKRTRGNNYGAVIINPIKEMEMIDTSPLAPVFAEDDKVFDISDDGPDYSRTEEHDPVSSGKKNINLIDAYLGESGIMDRELHSLPYFGEHYETLKPVGRDVFEAIVNAEEAEAEKEEITVNDVWFVEATLSELLNVAWVKALGSPPGQTPVQHFHGFVVTPVIGRANLKAYFEKIRPVVTFADFSIQSKAYIKAVSERTDGARELKDTLAAIAQVDRVLTKMLNHFLLEVIPVPVFSIDSAIQDGSEVVKNLNASEASGYLNTFMRYQRAVFETFFKHTRLENDSFSGVVEYEHDESVFIDQIAESYSILYMDGSPGEFKLLEHDSQLDITLHQLMRRLVEATSVLDNKKIMATRHILLFSDGSHYDMVKKADGNHQLKRM